MADKPSNSGVIVALIPDESYRRIRPTTTDHHLTIAFLGRYDDERITDKKLKDFWNAVTSLKSWQQPVQCRVTAEAMFDTPDGWAHVDLIDGPELPNIRCMVQEFLDIYSLPLDRRHGFLPHMTRRYIPKGHREHIEFTQRTGQFAFTLNRLALWAGDTRFELELR